MASDQWSRAKRLLNALLEAEPVDPEAWLTEQCDDPALRAEVKSLYVAHGSDFLEGGAPREWLGGTSEGPADRSPMVGRPDAGAQIGEYRLLEEVGLGGMSVVYRAERVGADFDQTVAVKLLQRRVLADSAEQRFRAEQQVLASLDHPNIARLIDGGVTESGRPYLVMEYVDGTPITQYADRRGLGLKARLDLLGQVLEAVQEAHRQLVVHRDLKPANILIIQTENGPRVKLLDFGIAKLLDDSLPVTRPETRTGHHLMTPSYAAPEQLTGADVTTATDVYQVGVLAYELLAGRRPFDVEGKSATEIERLITEEDPPRPSERTEGSPISPEELRGDLDRILQKALRKEPERRYRSTEALVADLERHRAGQPVEARPATLGYRTKKFVQRHRWGVGVAVAFLIVLATSGVVLVRQRAVAERQRDRAQAETQKAEAVSSFLVNLFRSASPESARGDTLTADELLERGAQRIGSVLQEQTEVQARVQVAMGRAYLQLGRPKQARILLNDALDQQRARYGDAHPEVARTQHLLGRSLKQLRRFGDAEEAFRAALSMRHALNDAPHPDIAASLSQLATVLHYQGRTDVADSLTTKWLEQYQALYREGSGTADLRTARALLTVAQFRAIDQAYAQAETYLREAAAIFRKEAGPESPRLAQVQEQMANVLVEQGKFEAAEQVSRKALRIRREVYGREHPETAEALRHLAVSLKHQERYDAAENYYRQVLAVQRRRWGEQHAATARARDNLADLLRRKGALEEAQVQYEKALAVLRQQEGPEDLNTLAVADGLGAVLIARGHYAEAQSLLRPAYAKLKGKKSLNAPPIRRSVRKQLVQLYEAWDKPSKAQQYASAGADRTSRE